MLERLTIRDFQKHEKLAIDFDPSITTIVGPSDAGKSAVIRAIGWLATNRPSGTDYIRHGAEAARVSLAVDGKTIRRRRSGTANTYKLDDKEYKAFGHDVPEPISKLLNIGDDNFQWQLDPPFWFTEGAPAVSRKLNAIIDLSVIDDVLANLAAQTRKAKTVVEVTEQRLADARAAAKGLAWVVQADADLTAIEAKADLYEKAGYAAADLRGSIGAARMYNIDARTAAQAATAAAGLLGHATQAKRLAARVTGLRLALAAARADKPRQPPDTGRLTVAFKSWQLKETKVMRLRSILTALRDGKESLTVLKGRALEATETLKRRSGGICPICQAPLKHLSP